MAINFDKITDRNNTNNFKWDKLYERYNKKDLLPFWIADSEIETSEEIINELVLRAKHGIYGYTFKSNSYYEAIENWFSKRYLWDIDREWITSSPGVIPALSMCIESFTNIGDRVIVFSPAYPSFYDKIKENIRKIVTSELVYNGERYVIDFEDFENKIKSNDCKLFIFCNPHNPSGRVWTKEEIVKIGEICLKNNMLIISDDIHCDIVYSGNKYIPISSVSKELSDITITCTSAGKTFNISGLATSVIIIPNKELREKYNKILNRFELADGNIFGNLATQIAYSKGEPWLTEMIKYIEKNRDFIINFISENKIPISCMKPEGTFMMLLDCNKIKIESDELFKYFIYDLGLVVNSGVTFGKNTSSFVRFNFSCPFSLIENGMNRLYTIKVNK